MKAVLLALLLIGLAVLFFTTRGKNTTPTPGATEADLAAQADANIPYWETPLPPNLRLVTDREPQYDVVVVRRDQKQTRLEFQITERQGLAADGISVSFWYRFQDEDDPDKEWIEDTKRIRYTCTKRLEPNATLVESTVILPAEFHHLGVDLGTTTTENWRAEVVHQMRLMEVVD